MRSLSPAAAVLGLFALGCPDPNPVGSYDELSGGAAAAPDDAGDAVPDTPPDIGASQPNDARWSVKTGEGIKLSGSFEYAGEKTGSKRLDFQKVTDGLGAPALAHTLEVRGGSEWAVEAPKNAGTIQIVAFIDADNNGPSDGDPGFLSETITIGEEDITEVVLTLTDDFDMGVLRPGGGGGGIRPVSGDPTATSGPPTPEGGDPNAPGEGDPNAPGEGDASAPGEGIPSAPGEGDQQPAEPAPDPAGG